MVSTINPNSLDFFLILSECSRQEFFLLLEFLLSAKYVCMYMYIYIYILFIIFFQRQKRQCACLLFCSLNMLGPIP